MTGISFAHLKQLKNYHFIHTFKIKNRGYFNAHTLDTANNLTTKFPSNNLLKVLGLAALYALLARSSLDLFAANGVISIIWPPSGLALAALLIGGKRYAGAVFIGAFVANVIGTISFWTAAGIAFGNTLEALAGVWLLTRKSQFSLSLRTLQDYVRLISLGGCVSCSIAALIGTATLLLSGALTFDTYFNSLIHWWMGDALGIILITPAILVWMQPQNNEYEAKWTPEAILTIGITFLAGQIVFLDWFHNSIGQLAKDYWMFLFVTWTALHLKTRGVLIVLIMTAAQGLWGAYHGTGYFANDIAASQLISFWIYTVILSLVGMALATFFTERHEAELKIQGISRLYAALSQCNQAIMRCTTNEELFSQICRDIVIFGGMKMAWIGLTNPKTQMVRVVASFGDDYHYLKTVQISTDAESPYGLGPTGTAIRENQPFWCQDLNKHLAASPCQHSSHGLDWRWRASAALPICRNGIPVGAFNLYSDKPNAFDEAERRLLIEMAADINFALDNYEREIERKKAEKALQKSEHHLRTIIETEPECVKIIDYNGKLVDMNQAGLAMLEAESVSEAQQQNLLDFVVPEFQDAFVALHKRVLNGEKAKLEFEIIGLRGTRRCLETHATPLRNETSKITMLLGVTRGEAFI